MVLQVNKVFDLNQFKLTCSSSLRVSPSGIISYRTDFDNMIWAYYHLGTYTHYSSISPFLSNVDADIHHK